MSRTPLWIAAALLGVATPGVATPGVATPGVAEPSFAINGLHIDLTFTEALAWAKERGGECATRESRTRTGRLRADCTFATCAGGDSADCSAAPADRASDSQLLEQVRWVGFEASDSAEPLGRAVIQFEDNPEAVGQALIETFGEPVTDTTDEKKSWSHSTRMGWRDTNRTMGLLTAEHMIILTVQRPPETPAP